jgi:hypothetical protein
MKTILFLFAFLLATIANSQVSVIDTIQAIPIGKTATRMGALQATLTQYIGQSDTTYQIWFYDQQHRGIALAHSVKFKASDSDLELIKSSFLSVFQEGNIANKSYAVKVKVGKEILTIQNYTTRRNTYAEIRNSNGYVRLSKSGVLSLFNSK